MVVKNEDIESKDRGLYCNTYPSLMELLWRGKDFVKIKVGDAGMIDGTDGDIDKRLKESTKQAQVAERDYIEIGRWIDPEGVSRDYDIRDELNSIMPGNKYDSNLGKEWHKVYPPKELLDNYRNMKSWEDYSEICDYIYSEIDKILRKKSGKRSTRPVKLRKIQAKVIDKIVNIMKSNGIPSNIIAELAPRFGKTLTFLKLFEHLNKEFGHSLMTIPVYWLSSLTSFKDELSIYRDFIDVEYVDKTSGDLNKIIPELLSKGKLVIVGISLHGELESFKNRFNFISKYKDKILSVEDEADYGNHTAPQREKLKYLYNSSEVTKIKMSGTNAARMGAGFRGENIHGQVRVSYSQIEQDETIPDVVKRKFFEMQLPENIQKQVEDYDPEIIPTWKKLGEKPFANQNFWVTLGEDIYGYKPEYGMSIDQSAEDFINYSMVFTSFTKNSMKNLAKIWNECLKDHHVVVIDGNYTKNSKAERLIKDIINQMKIGHIKKRKLIIITNMMGSRSFSVPEIQATLFFKDAGGVHTFIQQSQRDKTPLEGKKFGYTFDFAFDPNKLQNTSLSIVHEAKQVSIEEGISIVDSLRFVFNSLNLTRLNGFYSTLVEVDDLLKEWEDSDKILPICDEAADYEGIFKNEDVLKIACSANLASNKPSNKKLAEKIIKGKTYGYKEKNNQSNTSNKEKNNILKIVKESIKNINRSATTVYDFANGGRTFRECLDIVESCEEISLNFQEMYGVSPTDVKKLLPYLQENFLDICVLNTSKEFEK